VDGVCAYCEAMGKCASSRTEDAQMEEASVQEEQEEDDTGTTEEVNGMSEETFKLPKMEARLAQMEATMATLTFLSSDDQYVVNLEAEIKIIKQAIALAKSQRKPAAGEEKDLKAQRESWKAAIKQASKIETADGQKEIPLVKMFEAELAKLQPEPKAKSLWNQLKSANAAVKTKQDDRAKIVNIAVECQTQIDDLQQAVAKLDRQVADLDTELTELQKRRALCWRSSMHNKRRTMHLRLANLKLVVSLAIYRRPTRQR
jgi:hypothetical protein